MEWHVVSMGIGTVIAVVVVLLLLLVVVVVVMVVWMVLLRVYRNLLAQGALTRFVTICV